MIIALPVTGRADGTAPRAVPQRRAARKALLTDLGMNRMTDELD